MYLGLCVYWSIHLVMFSVQKILMCLSTLVKRTLLRPVSSHKCSNTFLNLQSWTIFPTITTKKRRSVIFNMYTCIPVCWVQPIWKIWVGLDHFPNFHGEYRVSFCHLDGWWHPDFGQTSQAASELDRLHTAWSNLSVCFGGDDESNWRERGVFFWAKKCCNSEKKQIEVPSFFSGRIKMFQIHKTSNVHPRTCNKT